MKYRLVFTILFCIIISTGMFAQITISNGNFPVAGLEIGRGYVVSYVNVLGSPGANQFYDFTDIVPVYHDSIKYLPASQTPWAAYHPGATIAYAEKAGDITYVYFYTPSYNALCRTGLTVIGDFGAGLDTVHGNYSDPDTMLSDQYTYGYSDTEYSTATIPNILTMVNYQIRTQRVVLVDGWGQLETPLNYYPGVLRVRYAEYRYDTAFSFGAPVFTVADTQYFFNYYAENVRHPVVKAHTDKNYNLQYFEYIYTPPVITGCLDTMAVNYNPMATQSDGSCLYCPVSYTITPDTTICEGSAITLNISGGTSYLWSGGSSDSSLTITPSGSSVYNVYVGGGPGCYALATVEVTVDKPVTALFWTTSDHYNLSDAIQFVNLSINASHYEWNFDDAIDGYSNMQYPLHTYSTPGLKHIGLIAFNTCYADTTADSLMIYDNTMVAGYEDAGGFVLYPNPGSDAMSLEGIMKEQASLEIHAIDMLGRKKCIAYYESIFGHFIVENDMSSLSYGAYLIEIIAGNKRNIYKWIKMN